tara:strand:- start:422 stop:556 length:135 start_codon:yes stop_codon:yes gene_type:complete
MDADMDADTDEEAVVSGVPEVRCADSGIARFGTTNALVPVSAIA